MHDLSFTTIFVHNNHSAYRIYCMRVQQVHHVELVSLKPCQTIHAIAVHTKLMQSFNETADDRPACIVVLNASLKKNLQWYSIAHGWVMQQSNPPTDIC